METNIFTLTLEVLRNVNTQLNYVQVGSEGTEELVGRVHEHHGQSKPP